MIDLAKDMTKALGRGNKLGLTEDELAFYDALETSDSAVEILGDETLKKIAQELTDQIRRNVSIDWTMKEQVRAKLRVMAKRILKKYKYPPDKRKKRLKRYSNRRNCSVRSGWGNKESDASDGWEGSDMSSSERKSTVNGFMN